MDDSDGADTHAARVSPPRVSTFETLKILLILVRRSTKTKRWALIWRTTTTTRVCFLVFISLYAAEHDQESSLIMTLTLESQQRPLRVMQQRTRTLVRLFALRFVESHSFCRHLLLKGQKRRSDRNRRVSRNCYNSRHQATSGNLNSRPMDEGLSRRKRTELLVQFVLAAQLPDMSVSAGLRHNDTSFKGRLFGDPCALVFSFLYSF